jgi:hypothetical protein
MAVGKWGLAQPILQESFIPTAPVIGARFVDGVGNQIAVAGARASGISDLFAGVAAAADNVNLKPIMAITLGSSPLELIGTVAAGDPLTSDNQGRGLKWVSGGGQVSAVAREAGVAGDRIRAFMVPAGAATAATATSGQAVLVAGTVTVAAPFVSASSIIMLTRAVLGGALGDLKVGVITPGVGFTIVSASGTDTSTINWFIVN